VPSQPDNLYTRDDLGMYFTDCLELTASELYRRQKATRDRVERATYRLAIVIVQNVLEDVRAKQSNPTRPIKDRTSESSQTSS